MIYATRRIKYVRKVPKIRKIVQRNFCEEWLRELKQKTRVMMEKLPENERKPLS